MAVKRFQLTMIVDASALHDVTAAAAGKSSNVQIIPVLAEHDNGAAPSSARIPARVVLVPWMAKHKQFAINDLIQFAAEHGHRGAAVYAVAAQGLKDGLLERISSGVYRTTKKLRAVAKLAARSNGAAPPAGSRQSGHPEFIIGLLKGHGGALRRVEMADAMRRAGRAAKSLSGVVDRMVRDKLIKKAAGGGYELTDKGRG